MPHIPIELEQSWGRAWRIVGARGDGLGVRDDLLARYAQPHRAYHTVQHMLECIATFSVISNSATDPAAVELALWFHDAIYDHKGKNEERSAELASAALKSACVPASMIDLINSLILITRHTGAPCTADEMAMVDVDLAILGSDPIRFAEYEQQIQQEYSHVPREQFVAGRKAVLESFLHRDRIYGTDAMFERLEIPARSNLLHSLKLCKPSPKQLRNH